MPTQIYDTFPLILSSRSPILNENFFFISFNETLVFPGLLLKVIPYPDAHLPAFLIYNRGFGGYVIESLDIFRN